MHAVGFPLALKIQSKDIAHKSEVGGIRLGITTLGAAPPTACCSTRRPDGGPTHIDGVLVGPMARKGVEIIVGSRGRDFGPMVMVGFGGVATELSRTWSIARRRSARTTRGDAGWVEAPRRCSPVFVAPRPLTSRRLVDLIVRLSRLRRRTR